MAERTKNLTEGNPLRLLISFTIPLFLGNLFQQIYSLADAAIVGQTLGDNAVAAVGVSSSVQFLILGFCFGIATGFSIPVASSFGAGKLSRMRRYLFNGSLLTALFAIVLAVVSGLLCHIILNILQTPAEIYGDAYAYLLTLLIGIPFTLLYNFLSSILRAVGNSRTPFLFLAFSSALNIGLDFFFILLLRLGVFGAAFATILSQGISGVLCLFVIHRKYDVLHLRQEDRVLDRGMVGTLMNMGVPMGLQFSITANGSMVMQSANNSLGTVYVAGYAAGHKINTLMMCPFDALSAALCTYLSQNYGGLKAERISQGMKAGVKLAVGWGILGGLILILFGSAISRVLVHETDVIRASAQYLRIDGSFYILLGFVYVFRMATQGLGWSQRAVFSGVFEMVARSLVAILLVPRIGYSAICFADAAAWFAADCYIIPTCLAAIHNAKNSIRSQLEASV